MTPHEGFWDTVDKSAGPDDCWPWTGALHKGYGVFRRKVDGTRIASRISYRLTRGPIPPRLLVCHSCDNPTCVNPMHLFLGTHRDNTLDMVAKGRQGNQKRSACIHGHAFTPENTLYERVAKSGGRTRRCRTCRMAQRGRI